jgi:alkylation response protein AidB-like acyl-CoA dehydrogenase
MATAAEVLARVRQIVADELKPRVLDIDLNGAYPEPVLKALGEAGLFALPVDGPDEAGLAAGLRGIALVGEQCASTAFLCWCQMVCALYLCHSANAKLRAWLLPDLATGRLLGGTALSNAMKAFAGIEPIRLHARRTVGGFRVTGHVPFVSNMGTGHWFAGVFDVMPGAQDERAAGDSAAGEAPYLAMAMFECDGMNGLTGGQSIHFAAMEGTRTFSLTLRSVFVPDELVLAAPVEPYLVPIVPGFVLLQVGIALGLVRDCLAIIRSADQARRHVNRFLPDGHDRVATDLWTLEVELSQLTATPRATHAAFMRRVLQARLDAAQLALRAGQTALFHAGAAGYVRTARAQRRLREAQFIAILTPAVRHLRWELDAIANGGGTMRRLKASTEA